MTQFAYRSAQDEQLHKLRTEFNRVEKRNSILKKRETEHLSEITRLRIELKIAKNAIPIVENVTLRKKTFLDYVAILGVILFTFTLTFMILFFLDTFAVTHIFK